MRVFGVLAAIVLVAALAVMALDHPRDPRRLPKAPDRRTIAVYVLYDGFHSDVAVPRARLTDPTAASTRAAAALAPSPLVAFGWGDAKFYRERGAGLDRLLDLLRAAFAPGNASTVHLERGGDPARLPPPWRVLRVMVTPEGFEALRRHIDAAVATAPDGRPLRLANGQTDDDIFFAGRGHASLAAECNQWTGALLGAAGAGHNPVIDATTLGLAWDLRLRAGATPVPRAAKAGS